VPNSVSSVGVRRVEGIMGTVFSLDVRDAVAPAAVDAFFARLRDADATFSTYRDDSEISRLNRGELALVDTDPAVREILARYVQLRKRIPSAAVPPTSYSRSPSSARRSPTPTRTRRRHSRWAPAAWTGSAP
jgi:thiamine biosynthesis lipoprotein ApbE